MSRSIYTANLAALRPCSSQEHNTQPHTHSAPAVPPRRLKLGLMRILRAARIGTPPRCCIHVTLQTFLPQSCYPNLPLKTQCTTGHSFGVGRAAAAVEIGADADFEGGRAPPELALLRGARLFARTSPPPLQCHPRFRGLRFRVSEAWVIGHIPSFMQTVQSLAGLLIFPALLSTQQEAWVSKHIPLSSSLCDHSQQCSCLQPMWTCHVIVAYGRTGLSGATVKGCCVRNVSFAEQGGATQAEASVACLWHCVRTQRPKRGCCTGVSSSGDDSTASCTGARFASGVQACTASCRGTICMRQVQAGFVPCKAVYTTSFGW